MSNNLSMLNQQAINGLIERGWSQRRIARETGFDRKTIRRHVRLTTAAKSSITTAGSVVAVEQNPPPVPPPALALVGRAIVKRSHRRFGLP
jgi:hypothetical protein